MNENRIAFYIIFGVLAFVGILWYAFENPALNPRLDEETYVIIRKWDMPNELKEISGISWIAEDKIACEQDEDGIIYIYNLSSELIEKKINFGKAGDYEAIATIDSTAYVMRSDGRLYEINNYLSPDFQSKEYKVPFSGKNNVESLTADKAHNRLLMTVKNKDPHSDIYKGIYAFDLDSKETKELPILKIPLHDPIFKNKDADDDGDQYSEIYPSDIAINPINGDIYVLEGKNPQLLIMDSLGKPIKLHKLHTSSFIQPEGITFAPDGTLYISNESGKKEPGNILEVELKE